MQPFAMLSGLAALIQVVEVQAAISPGHFVSLFRRFPTQPLRRGKQPVGMLTPRLGSLWALIQLGQLPLASCNQALHLSGLISSPLRTTGAVTAARSARTAGGWTPCWSFARVQRCEGQVGLKTQRSWSPKTLG